MKSGNQSKANELIAILNESFETQAFIRTYLSVTLTSSQVNEANEKYEKLVQDVNKYPVETYESKLVFNELIKLKSYIRTLLSVTLTEKQIDEAAENIKEFKIDCVEQFFEKNPHMASEKEKYMDIINMPNVY